MAFSLLDNPVIKKKLRWKTLQKRADICFKFMKPATVEYGVDGYAARFYPNIHPKRKKAKELHREIRKEQNEIEKWLHKYGYNLA